LIEALVVVAAINGGSSDVSVVIVAMYWGNSSCGSESISGGMNWDLSVVR